MSAAPPDSGVPAAAEGPLRLALEAAEAAFNRLLRLDPVLASGLRELAGRRVALCLEGLGVCVVMRVHERGAGFELVRGGEEQVAASSDVVISGAPLTLAVALARRGADGAFPDEVRIAGDMGVAQRVQRLFASLDIDWEEQLSRVLGDVAAHSLARVVRGVLRWGREAGERLLEQGGEYLTEEAGLLVGAREHEELAGAVEDLRDDCERLAARIARLERERGAGKA